MLDGDRIDAGSQSANSGAKPGLFATQRHSFTVRSLELAC